MLVEKFRIVRSQPRSLGRRLFGFVLASPAPSWPIASALQLRRYSFQNDPVAWLAHLGSLMSRQGYRQQGALGTEWSFRHLNSDWEYLVSLPDAHDIGRDTRSGGFVAYMGRDDVFERISRDLGDI